MKERRGTDTTGPGIQQLLEALERNGMEACWAPDRASALRQTLALIAPGDTVGTGGSVTLEEIGLIAALRSGRMQGRAVTFLDQYRPDLSRDESLAMRHRGLAADIFFSGANAITRAGEIVNLDGYGNRVAALAFGPKRVCVVAGVNKVVDDLPAALHRIRTAAAPLNCRRLKRKTPCAATGVCIEEGCRSPERICNVLSVIRRQPGGNRITVILVGEELGY